MENYAVLYQEFQLKFPTYSYNFDLLAVRLVALGVLDEDERAQIRHRVGPTDKKLCLLTNILPHKNFKCQLGFVQVLRDTNQDKIAKWLEARIGVALGRTTEGRPSDLPLAIDSVKYKWMDVVIPQLLLTTEPFAILSTVDLKAEERVRIRNSIRLGSYNNVVLCKEQRDILVVPGITHRLMFDYNRFRHHREDDNNSSGAGVRTSTKRLVTSVCFANEKTLCRDDEYNKRSTSVNLTFLALALCKPSTNFQGFDFVIDHRDMLKLFLGCSGLCTADSFFTIDLELVGKMVVATSPMNEHIYAEDMNDSANNQVIFGQNQQVIAYELGTLQCVVRFRALFLDFTAAAPSVTSVPSEGEFPNFANIAAPIDICPEMSYAEYGREYEDAAAVPLVFYGDAGYSIVDYANSYLTGADAHVVSNPISAPNEFTYKPAAELYLNTRAFHGKLEDGLSKLHSCLRKIHGIMMEKGDRAKATLMYFGDDKIDIYERDRNQPSCNDERILRKFQL